MTAHPLPVVLFGAFDRHNFGDMLFAHIVARMLADCGVRDVHVAGLAARDLRAYGGHRVEALSHWHERAVNLLHAGGELLTCDAWQAAVMLQAPEAAQRLIASHQHERAGWAQRMLGTRELAPYVKSRDEWPSAVRVVFNAVGGVALDARDAALRAEVHAKLARADDISVRDIHTQTLLAQSGIDARLAPDCAVMVAELFGDVICRHASKGCVARIREAAPNGYLAVQFSADFGDDATLTRIAAQLDRAAHTHSLAIVLFRAGAAPWHDDLSCFERMAARMRTRCIHLFDSLDIWDICALIAHSRGFVGSSLHGGIVAGAYALPHVSLLHDGDFMRSCKQIAFGRTWEACDDTHAPVAVRASDIAEGVDAALSVDVFQLRRTASRLVTLCRDAFQTTVLMLV